MGADEHTVVITYRGSTLKIQAGELMSILGAAANKRIADIESYKDTPIGDLAVPVVSDHGGVDFDAIKLNNLIDDWRFSEDNLKLIRQLMDMIEKVSR